MDLGAGGRLQHVPGLRGSHAAGHWPSVAGVRTLRPRHQTHDTPRTTQLQIYKSICVPVLSCTTNDCDRLYRYTAEDGSAIYVSGDCLEAWQGGPTWSSWDPVNRADRIFYRVPYATVFVSLLPSTPLVTIIYW